MIYTDTWSPRRQAAATATLNSGRGAAHLQSPGGVGAGGARKGHSHNADNSNSFEIAPSSCNMFCGFFSGSKPLIKGMRTCLQ